MTSPNRPPSCDRLNPELKECPFCGSEDVELRDGYDLDEINQYVRCNNCEADGPWSDDNIGTKWNSIPRRSEVAELLRLVEEVLKAPIYYANPQPFADLDNLKEYANNLRRWWDI